MKIKYFIIALILFFPLMVYAQPNATINTNKSSIEIGESVTATVTLTDTAAWNIKITGSGAATCSTRQADVTSDGKSTTKSFDLSCTSANSGTITFSVTGDITSGSGETKDISLNKNVTVKPPKSGNNNLSSLSIDGVSLSPSFNASTTSYTASTEKSSININATKEDSNASISGTGIKNLNYGNNTFNIIVTAENGTKKTYTITVNRIDTRSTNNNLKSLSVDSGSLNPTFNKNTTSYTVSTENSSIKINGTVEDSKSSVSGLGTKNLNYGNNTFNIEVTAENGSKKTYTITVNRKDTRSTNNNLKTLTIDKGTIKFNKNTTSYNVSVEDNITSIKVGATIEDSKATFVNGFGPRNINLNYGNNKIEIKVKAENESIKVYTINVNRKDNRSSNTELKTLKISEAPINFDPKQDTYDISVKNDVTKLDIIATPLDNKSVVTIDNKDLEEGLNEIKITVKSEKGETRTYTLNVTRLKVGEGLSDNNNIKSVKIKNYNINFNPNITSYNLDIKDENKLEFTIEMEDENSTYEIKGNENLINGSKIRIIAKSESGLTKEYVININKEEAIKEKEKSNIIIPIVFLIVSIIVLIIAILFARKKKIIKKNYQ